ncbi:helix-turn-helix domain-containing protein [Cohnella silvisoli]|uniref:Response regulator n=1 Tax=Cohnella silvisoli TaxID=2873699 RepID=A0ABV1KNN5_9BACL|nr:helix-turn-helix domain-containing protein [Cohnella silvisoli]MCD9021146.1 response regulator [Cohnella silvisoli]
MMKAMIVDDEYYIREGLKKSDLWKELAIEVVGEAEDGAAAWAMYQLLQPEILLLDINIPEMNGIELARSIRNVNEEAQIIFLTGYDEFQWVKEAIALQASDYLLKPVVREELQKALNKANERVKKREDRNQHVDQLQRQVHNYSKAAHEQWLVDLVQQRRPLAESLDLLASSGIHLDLSGHYAVLCSDIDDFASLSEGYSVCDRQLNQYAYRKLAEEAVESYEQVYTLGETPSRVVLLIGNVTEQSVLLDIAIRLRSVISQYLKLSISIGISNPIQGLEHISDAYHEAIRAMEYKAIVGGGQIIPYSSTAVTMTQNNRLLDKELYMLSEMRAGNEANVINILREWSENLRSMAWSDVKLVASQLVMFVIRLFKEVDLKNKPLLHANPLVDMSNCRTTDELIRFLTSYFTEVGRAIRLSKEVPSHRMIEQAKEWIREHLSEDLSLVNLAEYLNMSPKYLSSRFKQATSETFADFTTQVRFDRAKELLADSSLKILDVAAKVGFTDTNYFSMAFKKYIGITPTEYRKRFF